jgi:DNA-binding response OmpR family regulator
MKIIVTEDDAGIEDILKIILEKEGYQVELISDGIELIDNNFVPPDLLIIDMLLSGINGLDICRHLKRNGVTSNIPIIMMSASPSVELLAKNAGADGAIEKPFNRKNMLKLVAELLQKMPG